MKKTISLLCVMMALAVLLVGCQSSRKSGQPQEQAYLPQERTEELYTLSAQLTQYLSGGDIDSAMAMMDKTMTDAMDGKLGATWAQLTDSAGAFVQTGEYIGVVAGNYEAVEMTLVFENTSLIQRTVFDSENRISGLHFRNGEVANSSDSLPEGITQTSVSVDAGYPLDALITMPENGKPKAAVVLVHGSGPSDKDETIGANAVFRDLAYSLAQQGIATLRYDKRTYVHGAEIAASGNSITLDDEVALDAVAAVKLLKNFEGIDSDKVYLLGHSMGGGLLSYINSLGADTAGYIVMAGTPRNIWELSAEQNLLLADELEQGGDSDNAAQIRSLVEQERIKAAGLDSLGKEETILGMPVDYLQEFDRIDTIGLHLTDGLPVLILQGEKDRQVYMKDYTLWQEGLAQHPSATFISYPTLNHLFGEYTGEAVPFSQMVAVEYAQRTPVAGNVISDIADWLDKA